MFSNFRSLLGSFASVKIDDKAAYGNFGIQRQVRVAVSNQGCTSKRKFLSRDVYTALGDVRVDVVEPVHDPRGYNAEVIGEGGDIEPELFASKLRTHGGLPKDVLLTMSADIDRFIWDDSQISLLVALLSTYYVLTAKEKGYSPLAQPYDDGHVSFTLLDQICREPEAEEWWRYGDADAMGWDQAMHSDPAVRNILYTTGLSKRMVSVIKLHLAGRRKTTRLAFDLEIPPLADQVMMTQAEGDYKLEPAAITAADVAAALNAYVKVNRLEGAFEAAYAIYAQTALRPVPDTAEGMAWLVRPVHVVLPAFRAHRGLYAILLRDKPFGLSSAVSATWKMWRDMGLSVAVQGGLFNAVSLWGRYFVEAGYYHDDAEVTRLGQFEFATAPAAAYYCYASLVTGHDTYCPLPRNIGFGYDPWIEGTEFSYRVDVADADLTGYDITVEGDGSRLKVGQVPQPCSTVHVMGRMPSEGYFSTLSAEFDVVMARVEDGWEVKNVSQAWGVGLAARWLGYDVEMEYRGVSRRANWASNDTSMAARPFHVRGPDRRSVTIKGFAPRARVFANLPALGDDYNTWHVSYAVDDSYTVASSTAGQIYTRGTFYPPAERDQNILVIDVQTTMYTPITLRVSTRANVKQAGFHILQPDTSHVPPDPVRPSLGPEEEQEVPEEPPAQ